MSSKNHYIVLTAQGSGSHSLLNLLASLCAKQKCHILESKAQKFGATTAVMMLISGTWHAVAKLESKLPALEKKTDFIFHCKRTDTPDLEGDGLPYQAQLIATDRAGILADLCSFFEKNSIQVLQCHAETYIPSCSQTKLCQLQINIQIPSKSHIASIRDSFMAYCEELNLDALLEPLK